MLKISVITPTWNQAEFIMSTIESVVTQTYSNIEYIIVDNCSDDGTEDIIKSYMGKYPYIVYLREPDKGQADAINKGLEKATGDIICWINSDDFYYNSTVLERVVRCFEEDKTRQVVAGNGIYCNRNGICTEPIECDRHVPKWVLSRWYYLLQPAMFWKRENLLLDVAYQYVFDWKFFIQLQQRHDFFFFPECLAVYRMYEDNKTGLDNAKRKQEIYLLQREVGESLVNTAWCKLVFKVYDVAERSGKETPKRIINWMSRVLFHVSGKRICSF